MLVQFTNTSRGVSANAVYRWEFGNGNTSSLASPGALFQEEKKYTVKLTVTDGNQTAEKTATVTVYKKPELTFSASAQKGCAPFSVQFSANALPGDGSVLWYDWDFGDGSTQKVSVSDVQHNYQSVQQAGVSLTVTNSYGCYSTVHKPAMIDVKPPLLPEFAAGQRVLCRQTDSVQFLNTSTGPGTLSYAWDFGDGTTSTAKEPRHAFNKKGRYGIRLTVQSTEGCTAVANKSDYLNVASFQTDFDVPVPLCKASGVVFNNTGSPAPSQADWEVDGQPVYTYTPALYHTFYTAGTHTLRLINRYGNCRDTATKTVTVNEPPLLAGFIADIGGKCGAPVQVQFRDTTAGAVKWKWYLDNNTNVQSTQQAPVYNYTYDYGYWVSLEVTNAAGCVANIGQPLYIQRPSVRIISPQQGPSGEVRSCGPNRIDFKAVSSEPLTEWLWDFADGSTSTDSTPTHTYTKPGHYRVTLAYTTANGCKGKVNMQEYVIMREKVKADFTASDTLVCGNNWVTFTNKSGPTVYYHWNLGAGYFQASTGEMSQLRHQFTEEGVYTIGLIATDWVCADTIEKKAYIRVLPPFPKIASFLNTCEGTRGEVTLTQTSRKAESWFWEFGDGATYRPATHQADVKHTYNKTGWYKVALTTTNGACTVRDSVMVPVLLKQKPVLSADKKEICALDDFLRVSISNLERNPAGQNWTWGYGYGGFHHSDGSYAPGNASANSSFNDSVFTISLWNFKPGKEGLQTVVTSGFFGCSDSTNTIPLKVKGPIAGFTVATKPCQTGNVVFFKDNSQPQNGAAPVKWEWSFGDGKLEVRTTGDEFPHTYFWPGAYMVSVKVTDAAGCSSYFQQYVEAQNNSLKASLTVSATTISPGTEVQFSNTSVSSEPDNTTYRWILEDGSVLTAQNFARTYGQPGVYTVKLIAANTYRGCADTASVNITVRYVNAAFTFSQGFVNDAKCPPVRVQFNNTSSNISKIFWDFGDGTTSEQFSPSHLYLRPGRYIVAVKTWSDNGTSYTTLDSVIIKAPAASLEADKAGGCSAQTVTFRSRTENAAAWWWDFGDGTIRPGTQDASTHFYPAAGSYQPSLIVTDAAGCSAAVTLHQAITIDSLSAFLKKSPPKICTPKTLTFEPQVAGTSALSAIRYHWNFGTGVAGDTSAVERPQFSFTKPGRYIVRLTVTSGNGCVKQVTDTVNAFEGLGGVINGPAEVCAGADVQWAGATLLPGQPGWKWIFHDGAVATTQHPPVKRYSTAGDYPLLLVVNNNGCEDTVRKTVRVNPLPASIVSQRDVLVCQGATVRLSASGGSSYQWSPATGLAATNGAAVAATPATTTVYTVAATTDKGCTGKDSVKVTVVPPFRLSLPPQATVCAGGSVELKAAGANSYQWIGNTAGLSNTTIASPVATPALSGQYTVVGKDAFNCFADTASISVTVLPLPTVDAGASAEVMAGTALSLSPTYSVDVTGWNWTPADYLSCASCPAPVSRPVHPLTYTLTVRTADGCTASDTVSVKILCSGSRIFIPSVFTPNSDGKNDRFRIRAEGIRLIRQFRIYNRWGELVFEKTNFSADDANAAWDGKRRGMPVPEGAYVYFAELACNDQLFQQKGTITVVR